MLLFTAGHEPVTSAEEEPVRALKTLAVTTAFMLTIAACGGTASTTTQPGGSGATTTQGSGSTTTQPEEVDDRENVELTFTIWAAGPTLEAWQNLANGYPDVDPRVSNVNFEFVPFDRYHDVLNVRLTSDSVQHGGWLLVYLAPQYIRAGVLTDLEPVFSTFPGYEFDQIVQPAREKFEDTDGNGLYAYPFAQSPQAVFYNKDAFARAGVTTPTELLAQDDWTWETLRSTALAMQESGEAGKGFTYQVDFYDPVLGWRNLDNVYAAYQARPWSDDGLTCQFDSPEMIAGLQLVHDMIFVDGTLRGPGETNPSLWAGQAAMGMYHNAAAQGQSTDAFEIGMVPQPAGPGGWYPNANTSGLVVFDGAPNADIAAEFVAWLTSPENAMTIAQFHSSPRVELLTPSIFTQGLAVTEAEVQAAIIDTLAVAWRGPSHPNFGPIDRQISSIMSSQLWQADADVAEVMGVICSSIGELLGG